MYDNIESKLNTIFNALESSQISTTSSLMGGNMGISLFLSYYSSFTGQDKVREAFNNHFDNLLSEVCNGIFNPSFANGISGILYGISMMNENKLSDIDISHINKYYSLYLYNHMKAQIKVGNYDFLHGALGPVLYFLKLNDNVSRERLRVFLELLENSAAYKSDNIIFWTSKEFRTEKSIIDLSLSHGISSIIIILTKIFERNIEIQKCSELINKSIAYLLEQQLNHTKYGVFFPSYTYVDSINQTYLPSRLAWCYGDLGIAIALWNAGTALKKIEWVNKAIEIFYFSSYRKKTDNTGVIDSCVCHGSAGLAQIFRRIYILTGEKQYKDTSEYWIQKTVDMAIYKTYLADYRFWQGTQNGWQSAISLLEGISGVGLSLLAYIADDAFYSKWEEILLI